MAELSFPPPTAGVLEGIDPASAEMPGNAAPALLNVRASVKRRWETRRGSSLNLVIPGGGRTRFLKTLYEGDGRRTRLAARGNDGAVALYDLRVGTDLAFQAVTGGGSLAGNVFNAITVRDHEYITDRSGPLLRYDPDTRTATPVANIAAPTAAPVARKTWYGFLEKWPGSPTFGWTPDTPGNFTLQSPAADQPDLRIGDAAVARIFSAASSKGETIYKNATRTTPLHLACPSDTIAFLFHQTTSRALHLFDVGVNGFMEQSFVIDPPQKNVIYARFLRIGGLSEINYLELRNGRPQTVDRAAAISGLVLPGRLLGKCLWKYTYYDPTGGPDGTPLESSPSPAGPDQPFDFLAGSDYQNTTETGFRRCCLLTFAQPTSGIRIRIYREGGTANLTFSGGKEVYTYVGELTPFATQVNGAKVIGDTSFTLDSVSGIATDGTAWIVVNKGGANEEFFRVLSVAGSVVNLDHALTQNHADNEPVELGFLDNVANEILATEERKLDRDRDSPPDGIHWLAHSGGGRILAARFENEPLGVAFSSQPTPVRPNDQEIFPLAPDPYTDSSPTQGFRIRLPGAATGDQIMWAGFFRGVYRVLTRQRRWNITAYSQSDWDPGSIVDAGDRGCIAGETVRELNGWLYWLADGPEVVRWDGEGTLESVSFPKIIDTLANAPSGYLADGTVLTADADTAWWEGAFATAQAVGNSIYYRLHLTPANPIVARLDDLTLSTGLVVGSASYLFGVADLGRLLWKPTTQGGINAGWYEIVAVGGGLAQIDTPAGVTGADGLAVLMDAPNSLRLDYNVVMQAWEPAKYLRDLDGDGEGEVALGWECAEVRAGGQDQRQMMAATVTPGLGRVVYVEDPDSNLDLDVPIFLDAYTLRRNLGFIGLCDSVMVRFTRAEGEDDELNIAAIMGGSPDHRQGSATRPLPLRASGDTGVRISFVPDDGDQDRRPGGEWLQFRVYGHARSRPSWRELVAEIPEGREKGLLRATEA